MNSVDTVTLITLSARPIGFVKYVSSHFTALSLRGVVDLYPNGYESYLEEFCLLYVAVTVFILDCSHYPIFFRRKIFFVTGDYLG